jgi:hypothetical protein
MLTVLFIYLCRRITRNDNLWEDGAHIHGYIRYIGPFMVEWSRDTRKGEDRAVIHASGEVVYSAFINRAPTLRERVAQLFVRICKIAVNNFGNQWYESDFSNDHSIDWGESSTVSWGEFEELGSKHMREYAQIYVAHSRKPGQKRSMPC